MVTGATLTNSTFETLCRAALLHVRVSARRDKCTRADRPLIDDTRIFDARAVPRKRPTGWHTIE
jgi:hypothetical protein